VESSVEGVCIDECANQLMDESASVSVHCADRPFTDNDYSAL